MLKTKISGFLKLIRFELCIFGTIGFFVSGVLAKDLIGFQTEYLVGFLIIFLSEAGAFSINDYIDYEIDKKNNRSDRPLVSGLINRKTALIAAITFLIIDLLLILFLNAFAAILSLISIPLFYIYSLGLKKKLLVKNLLIAYSYTGTILFGSLVSDAILEPIIIYFAIMGFIIGLGSEIMFDIADVEGDKELGINTIPNKFGLKIAAKVSIVFYIIIIILDPLPFFILIDSWLYFDFLFLILILLPVISYIFLSISLLKNQTKENTLKLRKLIFVIMQIEVLSYLIGVLF
ncbi:MAG: UbiA family prenyltransferase [Candidatus Lokiarchaeota archaeon]|nr:UbiA family prenyltransferase [Candidatus Lokiarchaeota archaeon]